MRKLTIESISHLAKERGGELLSSEYKNGRSQLLWKCSQGHEWKALIQNIKRGHWCPYCSGNVVWSPGKSEQEARLSECQSLAQELGGKCLSSEYKSNSAKLNWQCAQGHIFSTTRTSVKNGHWCNICSGNAKKNLWESDNKYFCCEVLGYLTKMYYGMSSPVQIMASLKNKRVI